MELKSKDIRSLILELGKIHKDMVSLQKELNHLRNLDNKIDLGTNIAISSNKLKPKDINYKIVN